MQRGNSFWCNRDDLVTSRDKLIQFNLRRLDLITQHFDLVAQLLALISLFYLLQEAALDRAEDIELILEITISLYDILGLCRYRAFQRHVDAAPERLTMCRIS